MTAQVRVLLPVFSLIAQLVERTAVNREVVGSSPAEGVTMLMNN